MTRGPELSPASRGKILGLRETGLTLVKIASLTGQSYSTVQYTVKQAQKRGPKQETLKRSGRPQSSSTESYHRAVGLIQENQWSTVAQVEEVYQGTVRAFKKRLAKDHPKLIHKMSSRQQVLSEAGRIKRLAFVEAELSRLDEHIWKNAWFTDECMIKPGQIANRPWVWVPWGKSGHPSYTAFTPERSAGLMIWGAIHSDGRVVLLFPLDYQDGAAQIVNGDIYLSMLRTFIPQHYNVGEVWIQDNARPHTARQCRAYLAEQQVTGLDWPPNSPDLNVIENFWKILKHETHKRHPQLQSLRGGNLSKARQIQTAVLETTDWLVSQEGWNLCQTLTDSWPRRLQAVKDANGARTKY